MNGIQSPARAGAAWWASALVSGATALILVGAAPAVAAVQQPATATTSLVFDGVTVVDVERGKLLPAQRVVIVGNRIQRMGDVSAMKLPKGAQVVDARGKYLIPGLWDMHTHAARVTDLFYPLFVANGVTGIRDAGSPVPLDTLLLWRREILAGTRVGPPRQILSGHSLSGPLPDCEQWRVRRANRRPGSYDPTINPQICVVDSADAVHFVDSLKAAGADMIKVRDVRTKALYLAIAAEARRQGIPFGGHITNGEMGDGLTFLEASDSGMMIVDHEALGVPIFRCWGPAENTTVEQCRPIAERFRRNGTWWVPTLMVLAPRSLTLEPLGPRSRPVYRQFEKWLAQYWSDSARGSPSLHNPMHVDNVGKGQGDSAVDTTGYGDVAQSVGMPILVGSDAYGPSPETLKTLTPGFSLHAELAIYVAEGLTSLNALQAATLNPAKMLHATDSLGTVAPGKLADLVLLDADPLADITNTTTIRAIVANGRYFDRAALDKLLADVRTKAKSEGP